MAEQKDTGEWFEINSTNLDKAKWTDGEMRVLFKSGRTWAYQNVSEETWEGFKATFTAGASAYFGTHFRHWPRGSEEVIADA